ncbi:MAG: hypothetical protein HC842_03855 [Cytophagales bacterium]|nr:hypothetical protein [Cytophagales bacterium]
MGRWARDGSEKPGARRHDERGLVADSPTRKGRPKKTIEVDFAHSLTSTDGWAWYEGMGRRHSAGDDGSQQFGQFHFLGFELFVLDHNQPLIQLVRGFL